MKLAVAGAEKVSKFCLNLKPQVLSDEIFQSLVAFSFSKHTISVINFLDLLRKSFSFAEEKLEQKGSKFTSDS